MNCTNCGEPLGDDGLCAICLLAGGLNTSASMSGTEVMQEPVSADADAAGQDLAVDHFGPYTILKPLGEGGMGTVYLAEQTSPIQRKVAIKVIKPGMDSKGILARFQYERQALALMDHPNIARVFDASSTAKGRPFFVMEYIDGEPITTYCDRHRLNTNERLKLFIPVCQALQHAHSKGVLHRDIKPSNVLVAEVDGAPVPKVIDFGIAKATDQRNVENTMFTQFGQFVGTPEYMSPEAADLVNNDVDTTSDVYSLGVLLYELLVGAVPFDSKTLRQAGLAEWMRIIREDEAPSMAAKLTQMGQTGAQIAELRRTDLPGLKRTVRGDLNWIVTKAVEKSRQRRYPSAAELLDDIDRHLSDRPVKASPPSKIYQASKFVRRNRAFVMGAAAVAAALLIGIATTIWQAHQATQGRAEAMRQKVAAEQSAQQAREQEQHAAQSEAKAQTNLLEARNLANSMLFELDDKVKDLGGSTPAQQALVRLGAASLAKSAKGDPMLGVAYFRLGELQGPSGLWDIDGARESYRQSVELLEEQWNKSHDKGVGRQLALAYSRQGTVSDEEVYQDAAYRRAAKLAKDLLERWPNDPTLIRTAAEVELAGKQPAKALAFLSKTPPTTVGSRVLLAKAQQAMAEKTHDEDAAQALDWSLKAAKLMDAAVKEAPQNATFRMQQADNLRVSAAFLADLNRYDEAFANARTAVAIGKDLAAMDPDQSNFHWLQAQAEVQLALIHRDFGEPQAAQSVLDVASKRMAAQVRRFPHTTYLAVKYAQVMSLSANVLQLFSGVDRGAEARYVEVLEGLIRAERVSPNSRILKRWQSRIAALDSWYKAQRGDLSGALKSASAAKANAVQLQQKPEIEDRLALASALWHHANVLFEMERPGQAIAEAEKAANALNVLRRASHSDEVKRWWHWVHAFMSEYQYKHRDYRAAVRVSGDSLRVAEADYAARPGSFWAMSFVRWHLINLGESYVQTGDTERGLALLRRRLVVSRLHRIEHPLEVRSQVSFACSYAYLTRGLMDAGRRNEGLAAVREGWESITDGYSRLQSTDRKSQLVSCYLQMVRASAMADRPEAVSYGQEAIGWAEALIHDDRHGFRKLEMLDWVHKIASITGANPMNLNLAISYSTRLLEVLRRNADNLSTDWIEIASIETMLCRSPQARCRPQWLAQGNRDL